MTHRELLLLPPPELGRLIPYGGQGGLGCWEQGNMPCPASSWFMPSAKNCPGPWEEDYLEIETDLDDCGSLCHIRNTWPPRDAALRRHMKKNCRWLQSSSVRSRNGITGLPL